MFRKSKWMLLVSMLLLGLVMIVNQSFADGLGLTWPVLSGEIYQEFHPENHPAIDIQSTGDDTIYSSESGVVVKKGWPTSGECYASKDLNGDGDTSDSGETISTVSQADWVNRGATGWTLGVCGGYMIKIHHPHLPGGEYHTSYHHLKEGSIRVSVGQNIGTGKEIAEMGCTGTCYGKHLHFVLDTDGGTILSGVIDPEPHLTEQPGGEPRAKIVARKTGAIVNHNWRYLAFEQELYGGTDPDTRPILIANVCSQNGNAAVHLDIKDVTTKGFWARLEEPEALDGAHSYEQICYIAIAHNASYWHIRDYEMVTQPDRDTWYSVTPSKWRSYYKIAANIVTERGDDNTHIDIKTFSDGFKIRLEEDPLLNGAHGMEERVDWVIWTVNPPPGVKINQFENVTHTGRGYTYGVPFTRNPLAIARIVTENGGDQAWARIDETSKTYLRIEVEEVDPCGECTHGIGETIHWITVEPGVLE
jgi:hypothetical protein